MAFAQQFINIPSLERFRQFNVRPRRNLDNLANVIGGGLGVGLALNAESRRETAANDRLDKLLGFEREKFQASEADRQAMRDHQKRMSDALEQALARLQGKGQTAQGGSADSAVASLSQGLAQPIADLQTRRPLVEPAPDLPLGQGRSMAQAVAAGALPAQEGRPAIPPPTPPGDIQGVGVPAPSSAKRFFGGMAAGSDPAAGAPVPQGAAGTAGPPQGGRMNDFKDAIAQIAIMQSMAPGAQANPAAMLQLAELMDPRAKQQRQRTETQQDIGLAEDLVAKHAGPLQEAMQSYKSRLGFRTPAKREAIVQAAKHAYTNAIRSGANDQQAKEAINNYLNEQLLNFRTLIQTDASDAELSSKLIEQVMQSIGR